MDAAKGSATVEAYPSSGCYAVPGLVRWIWLRYGDGSVCEGGSRAVDGGMA